MNSAESKQDNSSSLSLLSWNIQVGRNNGLLANGWSKRKILVVEQIAKRSPEIICLQEPVWEQLTYIRQALQHFDFVGCGRDDGEKGGEFCPILFDARRFRVVKSGTFWMSDEPAHCHKYWDFPFKRICTWAQVAGLKSSSEFFVFNSHFPLRAGANEKSSSLIAQRKLEICGSSPCFIAGDFNCDPNSFPAKAFHRAGMKNCASVVGNERQMTIKLFGKPVAQVDGVFASETMSVLSFEVMMEMGKPDASDHRGIFVRSITPGLQEEGDD